MKSDSEWSRFFGNDYCGTRQISNFDVADNGFPAKIKNKQNRIGKGFESENKKTKRRLHPKQPERLAKKI